MGPARGAFPVAASASGRSVMAAFPEAQPTREASALSAPSEARSEPPCAEPSYVAPSRRCGERPQRGGLPRWLLAADHGRRRCPPTQRQEHGFTTRIVGAIKGIMEAVPFSFRPRPTRAGTASEGVAGRKEHGRGGAETTGVPGVGRRDRLSRVVVDFDVWWQAMGDQCAAVV